MNLYLLALFVHIVGALLLAALLAIEGFTLRTGATAPSLNRVLGPITLAMILIPGSYIAFQTGWRMWMALGLAGYAVIAAVGAYTGISLVRGHMTTGAATLSWLVRSGLTVGIVFDMVVKPGAGVS